MAQLATLEDVAAIGGLPVDAAEDSPEVERATRLLELVSGAVLVFLDGFGVSEVDVLGDEDDEELIGWAEFRRDALAGVVAEIASKRLNVSAAASVDPYATPQGPQTIKLNRWEKRAILDILPVETPDEGEDATGAASWFEP
jgi:hypothetical protein